MISLDKNRKKIEAMQEGGKMLASVLADLVKLVKPGNNFLDIEKKAVQLIKTTGGKSGFKRVPNYNWACCINVNEGIVHGVPKNYVIQENDIVSIDIGLYYKGYNTDMCTTLCVENPNNKHQTTNNKNIRHFLSVGRDALEEAKKQVRPGNRVGHISQAIQQTIEGSGYNVARTLTGHGVGKKLHESPPIPCFLKGKIEQTPLLKKDMTLAIEVIYCMGQPKLEIDSQDSWTIKTKDGKISAVFEETIAIKADGCLVLTKLPTG